MLLQISIGTGVGADEILCIGEHCVERWAVEGLVQNQNGIWTEGCRLGLGSAGGEKGAGMPVSWHDPDGQAEGR